MSEVILPVDHETGLNLDSNIDTFISQNVSVTIVDTEFAAKFDAYAIALSKLQANLPPSNEATLQLLLARDALQKILETEEKRSVELLLRLPDLDEQLKNQEQAIVQSLHLTLWRKVLHPPLSHWWWFFEATPVPTEVHALDKLDWLFNLLSVLCITGFVSFASKIIPLVFSNGLSVFESVGLLGPGGMIALVLSSMQGGEGRQKLQQIMEKFGIPLRFQSEATFLISFILFTGGYFAKENLPKQYFNAYIEAGKESYSKSQIREARDHYENALKIDGQDPTEIAKIYVSIGLLSESLGNNNEASKSYYQALDAGNPNVLNNLARVKIYKGELDTAETFLTLGIQRVEPQDINAQYQLYRNLGWIYLEKKRYPKAEEYLNKAIEFDKQLPKGNFGKGMANCFKARVYDLQERPTLATNQWSLCLEFGKPETLYEYEAILKMNPEVGSKLDSTGVFK